MFVILKGFFVVLQVEVSIAHLAINSTQCAQVACTILYRGFKKVDTFTTVTSLAVPLPFKS